MLGPARAAAGRARPGLSAGLDPAAGSLEPPDAPADVSPRRRRPPARPPTPQLAPRAFNALGADRVRVREVLGHEPLAARAPGPSSTHGRPSKRGSERNAAHALAADLAVAEVDVAVAVGAQRRRGVVDVQRAEPVEADDARRSRRARAASASAVRTS